MRVNRLSGSEGGARFNPLSLPQSQGGAYDDGLPQGRQGCRRSQEEGPFLGDRRGPISEVQSWEWAVD